MMENHKFRVVPISLVFTLCFILVLSLSLTSATESWGYGTADYSPIGTINNTYYNNTYINETADLSGYWTSNGSSTATGNWNLGANDLTTTGNIYNKADNSKHYFGAGDDYSIEFDGTSVMHKLGASKFLHNTGNRNLAMGVNAGTSITGSENVFLGYSSGGFETISGSSNVGLGSYSLVRLTSGEQNMGIGHQCLTKATTGSDNVAIGMQNLYNVATTDRNTAIGSSSLYSTTGEKNTGIGYRTLYTTTGSSNIAIGHGAGYRQTGSNKLIIDNTVRADEATETTNAILYGVMAAAPADQDLYINADLFLKADSRKLLFGAGDDASITYDGTNMIFNSSEVGSGLAYFSNNISATGFITRTDVFDKSKSVSALDYIKDADDYLTTDGKVNHSAFEYSAVSYNVTDFSKPIVTEKQTENCEADEKTGEEVCEIVNYNETTYPYKKVEEGVDLVKEASLLKQATFELKTFVTNILNRLTGTEQEIEDLQIENELIKSELCKKDNSYSWCIGVIK
jgi:hypothetical protein